MTTVPETPVIETLDSGESRREFLSKFASGVFAGLVAPVVLGGLAPAQAAPPEQAADLVPLFDLPPAVAGEDPTLRMMQDLRRALAKPVDKRRWVMAIDLRKCVGCHACTIACVSENKLPPGVVYCPVLEEEIGTYPNVTHRFLPRPCMQCDEPPCVPVCPVNATYKRPDGVVEINYNQCIGCRYCIAACPYNARTLDYGEYYTNATPAKGAAIVGQEKSVVYEKADSFEYDRAWPRQGQDPPIGKVRKCQFCLHRLNAGMLPACVTTCIGRATYFGDANTPDSLVSELIGSKDMMRLKEEMGTVPKVYYRL